MGVWADSVETEVAVDVESVVELIELIEEEGGAVEVVFETTGSASLELLDAVVFVLDATFGGPKNEVMLAFARGFFVVDAASSAALRLADMAASSMIFFAKNASGRLLTMYVGR